MRKRQGWSPESPNIHLRRCLLLWGIVWVSLQIPTTRRMGMMTKMTYKIQSWASRANITKQAGNVHDLQNGTAWYADFLPEPERDWRIDLTRMGGCGRLLPMMRECVLDGQIVDSSSCEAATSDSYGFTHMGNMWRANWHSWYHPQNIAKTARAFATRQRSYEARILDTTVILLHWASLPQCSAWFTTDLECEACLTFILIPMHRDFIGNYHKEIRFGWRHGDGPSVSRGMDRQMAIYDDWSLGEVICVPILWCVSYYLISLTTMGDIIIRLCISKGYRGPANVQGSKSSWLATNELDIIFPVTIEWESQN